MSEITENQRLQLIGLLLIGDSLRKRTDDVADSIGEILGLEDEGSHYYGHASDTLYEGGDAVQRVDDLLKKLQVSVSAGRD